MGTVWAVLLVIGILIPSIALVATGAWVHRLGRRIRALDAAAALPWQLLLLHLATVLGVQVASSLLTWVPGIGLVAQTGVAALAAMAFLPLRLQRKLVRLEAGPARPEPAAPHAPALTPGDLVAPSGRPWGPALLFAATGMLLPWAVAVVIKTYLDAHGRPTLPYSDFIGWSTTPVILVLSLATWSFPFLILAGVELAAPRAMRVGGSARQVGLPAWLAFGTGVAVAVPVSSWVFRDFDAIYLILPLGVLLLLPMAGAYAVGLAIARRRRSSPLPARS